MHATRRIDLPDVTLSVIDEGPDDAPPVVLLHGFPDRGAMWEHQIDALVAAGHRVVAPDLRGFGDSDRPDEVADYRLGRAADDVVALLDRLGLDRVVLAGHDWGSALGWSLARRRPDLVERYAAFSVGHAGAAAGLGTNQPRMSWYMLWFLAPGVAEEVLPADDWAFFRSWGHPAADPGDPLVARQVADLSRPGALVAALNWYRANVDPRHHVLTTPPAFPPLPQPVLGVWSTGDLFVGEAQMTGSARYVAGGFAYERVTGAGHWIPVAAPDRCSELLVRWAAPDQDGRSASTHPVADS